MHRLVHGLWVHTEIGHDSSIGDGYVSRKGLFADYTKRAELACEAVVDKQAGVVQRPIRAQRRLGRIPQNTAASAQMVDNLAPLVDQDLVLLSEMFTDVRRVVRQGKAAALVCADENVRIRVDTQLKAGQEALGVGHRHYKTSY
jgi:hypothetical protein